MTLCDDGVAMLRELSKAVGMGDAFTRPIDELRATRSSIKWHRYDADVLPVFVAEMDFDLAPNIIDRVTEAIRHSDTGYLDNPGALAPAFARYAADSWGWTIDETR